jgi:hypothetical protein
LEWTAWLGKVQVTYGILENLGLSELNKYSSNLVFCAISATYNIWTFFPEADVGSRFSS